MDSKYAEQAERLRAKLAKEKWPQKYMFKFIMPNSQETIDKVLEILPTNGKTTFNNSKNGKYVAITCVTTMMSAEAVMDITTKACEIPNVMSL